MACNCSGGVSEISTSDCAQPNCTTPGCNTASGCGCGCNQSGNATPTPYYLKTPGCQENHATTIVQQQYVTAVTVANAFNIPASGGTAVLSIPGLEKIILNSYLWNPAVGYLKVTGFDEVNNLVVVTNDNNLAAGVAVGDPVLKLTLFTVTPTPCNSSQSGSSSIYPYLAVDFTAPANGQCLLITVTKVDGLVVGKNIQIKSGVYRLSAVNSSTTITICNDGQGLAEGSTVEAQDALGSYVVPITLVDSNPCTNPSSTSGTILVCKNGIMKPLEAMLNGQIPVVTDAATGTVEMKVIDYPTLECQPLQTCLTLMPGTADYAIEVLDTTKYPADSLIHIQHPVTQTVYEFSVKTVTDATHLVITMTPAPAAQVDFPCAGVAVCQAPCCDALSRDLAVVQDNITDLYTYINNPCGSEPYRQAIGNMIGTRAVAGYKNYQGEGEAGYSYLDGTKSALWGTSVGGTADDWLELEVVNDSCRNTTLLMSGSITVYLEGETVGAEVFSEVLAIPQLGYEIFAIGAAGTRPWLGAGGNYTQSPAWHPARKSCNTAVSESFTLTVPFMHNAILGVGNTFRLAVRPQTQLDPVVAQANFNIKSMNVQMQVAAYPR